LGGGAKKNLGERIRVGHDQRDIKAKIGSLTRGPKSVGKKIDYNRPWGLKTAGKYQWQWDKKKDENTKSQWRREMEGTLLIRQSHDLPGYRVKKR